MLPSNIVLVFCLLNLTKPYLFLAIEAGFIFSASQFMLLFSSGGLVGQCIHICGPVVVIVRIWLLSFHTMTIGKSMNLKASVSAKFSFMIFFTLDQSIFITELTFGDIWKCFDHPAKTKKGHRHFHQVIPCCFLSKIQILLLI